MTQNARSIGRSRGRGVARRRIASCWRSTRFSATRLARGRSAERSVPITACRMASIVARFAPAALPVTRESLWPTRYAARWPRTRCVRRNPEKMHSSSPQRRPLAPFFLAPPARYRYDRHRRQRHGVVSLSGQARDHRYARSSVCLACRPFAARRGCLPRRPGDPKPSCSGTPSAPAKRKSTFSVMPASSLSRMR